MKNHFPLLLFLLVFVSTGIAQTPEKKLPRNPKIEQELFKLEEEWHNAYVKHDATPLERILADEYVSVGASGSHAKAQAVEGLKADTATYDYSTPYDLDVRVYGDTAVVIGRTKEKGRAANGNEFTAEYRWTDVFVKRQGRWQCVAAQVVRVPPPKPAKP